MAVASGGAGPPLVNFGTPPEITSFCEMDPNFICNTVTPVLEHLSKRNATFAKKWSFSSVKVIEIKLALEEREKLEVEA